MVTLVARIGMIASWIFFTGVFMLIWIAALFGELELLWDVIEIDINSAPPPMWMHYVGLIATSILMFCLGVAYWAVEQILRKAAGQNFYHLAKNMRLMAIGLGGFWLCYNLMIGVLPFMLTAHLTLSDDDTIFWQPFDIDFILLIVAIVLYAVSNHLRRAGDVERENQQFV